MTLEEKLAAVAALARQPVETGDARWQTWLTDPQNVVVARVVEIIAQQGLTAYLPQLRELFDRLLSHAQPAVVDKLCRAKEALVLALDALGNTDAGPYLRGVRYVQMEPVYGGRADMAAGLRGQCATALARLRDPEAYCALTPLLFDPDVGVRLTTCRVIAYLGGEKSELLLRMKVFAGDADPEVLGECFIGVLASDAAHALPFIVESLAAADRTIVEQAALALGQARLPESFPVLRERWEANTDLELRKPLLLALALTRDDKAFAYLLTLLREEGGTTAVLACEALALFAADRRYRDRLEAAVVALRSPRVTAMYLQHFPPAP